MASTTAQNLFLAESLKKTFPPALVALVQEIVLPVPDFARIANFIKADPILTANILTLVNSPFYALSQNIQDIKRATVILGIRELLKITLSVSLYHSLCCSKHAGIQSTMNWRMTIWSSVSAQAIAELCCADQSDAAYLGALLKDISLFLLDQNLLRNDHHHGVKHVSSLVLQPNQLQREETDWGANHAQLSMDLLDFWKLPPDILNSVQNHHDMDGLEEYPTLTRCVILATRWSELEIAPVSNPLNLLRFKNELETAFQHCNFSYEQLRETVLRRFSAMVEILGLTDQDADVQLQTLSMEVIQRLFFLSLDFSQSIGGLSALARFFQKHLHHQWHLDTWELSLAWPREERWSFYRCESGRFLPETQAFANLEEIDWTDSWVQYSINLGNTLYGDLRVPPQDISHASGEQLRQYLHFAALALEQYNQRTAVLEDKADILDGLRIGVARLDFSGKIVEANPSLLRLLHMNQVRGLDICPMLRKTGMISSDAPWHDFLRDENADSLSSLNCPSAMTPPITTPCLYLSAHKIREEHRQGILLILEDIKDIAELQASMHKQRDFLNGLINAMRDVIFTVDVHGTITFTSKHLPPTLLGKNLFQVTSPSDSFAGTWDEHLLESMTMPQEVILLLNNGETMPLELIISPLSGKQDHFLEYLVVGRDLGIIRRLGKKLRYQAMFDELTGLFNQRFFRELLDREISRSYRKKHVLSMIFCDLDGFKHINDTKGHQAGDHVLEIIGKILRDSCRKGSDFPARYGGDEFVVLSTESNTDQLSILARRIMATAERTFQEKVGLSIGIAQYVPGEPADHFLNRADRASYQAKKEGGHRIVIATETTQ